MFKPADLFDLSQTEHAALFDGCTYAWEALKKIKAYVEANAKSSLHNKVEGVAYIGDQVFIGEGTVVEDGAMIKGPAIIGKNCQIRHNAYIREHVIVGDGCVVGNSSELKNVLLFNGCQVPHFNYLGDSILGYKAHLGAGVILSNVRLDRGEVTVRDEHGLHRTGLRKFGAIIGDHAEVGCNSCINPGSLLGRRSLIFPLTTWVGVLGGNKIAKNVQKVAVQDRL